MKKKYYWIIISIILILLLFFFYPKQCSKEIGDEFIGAKKECSCIGITGDLPAINTALHEHVCYGICYGCICYQRNIDNEGNIGDWSKISCEMI